VLIVVGGTAAVTLICFPLEQIKTLLSVFFKRTLGKNKKDYNHLIKEIVTLSEAKKIGRKNFDQAIKEVKDHFLKSHIGIQFEQVDKNISREFIRREKLIDKEIEIGIKWKSRAEVDGGYEKSSLY